MDLPSHPEADDSADAPAGSTSWPGRIIVGAIVALLIVVVLLHLTGLVGPGAH